MTTSNQTFAQALASEPLDVDALGRLLDAMDEPDRVVAVRSIRGKDQARIWAACEGRGTTLDDIVPPGQAPATQVIHAGKNSLPLFTHFEKRFCRTADDPNVLYGYNEGATRPLVGPGCFVAHYFPDRGEVGVDYYKVPPADTSLPDGWPAVKPNEAGIQRFVYAKMVDYLRKVSRHVTIGRAVRQGKETGNYFLLCRTGTDS